MKTFELHVVEGPDRDRVFRPVGEGPYVFGRAGTLDRDLALPTDGRVGRQHLVLEEVGGRLHVRVSESKYQLWVDGQAVRTAVLRDGSVLALGETRMRVVLPQPGPAAPAKAEPLVPRRALAEFELGTEIGFGGQGRVLDATDRRTGERVAIKLLREDLLDDELVIAHFVRETDMLCRVQHPNVVRAVGVGRDAGQLFLAMERLPGRNLEALVVDGWTLTPAEAVAVGQDVLRALAHAHGLGVVHRDVKPHNVVVHSEPGRAPRAWLLDFGLAKPLGPDSKADLTATGQGKGTFQFAPPECLLDVKHVTAAADLFGAAATLYWALTGHLYFDEERYAEGFFHAVLNCEVVPLRTRRASVPEALATFVEDGLKLRPEDRWPSAAAALARLGALLPTPTSS